MTDEQKYPDPDVSGSSEELDREEEYREWLAFAQTDYDCAKYLNEAPLYPKPLNIICYHCQQAAEKAVKGLIVYFGSQGGMPKVHDISFLLNQIKHIVQEEKGIEVSHSLLLTANALSKYGVAPRYPNEIDVNDAQAGKALKDAETIMTWVKDAIAAEAEEET